MRGLAFRLGAAAVPSRGNGAVTLINGSDRAEIGVGDRGLLYGDGLFETIAIRDGAPCRWSAHVERLARGARRLGIPCPDHRLLRSEADQLAAGITHGVLRLTLTRGPGRRGYRPPLEPEPTRVLMRYAAPAPVPDGTTAGVRLRFCRTRLGQNPQLAGIKHLNRLEQVLARSEWQQPQIFDGVMADSRGNVISGTMTNLFLVDDQGIATPSLRRCGVAGTARALVFECAAALCIPVIVRDVSRSDLYRARALFVTNSLIGLLPVVALGQQRYDPGAVPSELSRQVREALTQPETPK